MPFRRLLVLVAVLATGGLAVGGLATAATRSASAKSPSAKATNLHYVSSRLLKDGELRGYTRYGKAVVLADPAAWSKAGERPKDTGRLRSLGFLAGASRAYRSKLGFYALATVERFTSKASAVSERNHYVATVKGATRFTVPGVPGAIGLDTPAGRSSLTGGRNVFFTHRSTFFLVGFQRSSTEPTEKELFAVLRRLYANA